MIFATVPFRFDIDTTVQRAKVEGGEIVYLEEPKYHGNPIDDRGSLVFYDYGYDFLQWFRDNGFKDAYFQPFYSVLHENIGVNKLFTLIVIK